MIREAYEIEISQMIKYLLLFCLGAFVGRCCSCYIDNFFQQKKKIKTPKILQTPFPEVINGILWVITAIYCETKLDGALYCFLASILFMIAVVDFCTYEIPFVLNTGIAFLGLVRICTDFQQWNLYLLGGLLAGGIFFLVYFVTKRRGIGGGDIKLMAAAGLVLGGTKIFFALFLGCLLAVIIHPVRMKMKKTGHTFALGPYLAVSLMLMAWFGDTVLLWYEIFC